VGGPRQAVVEADTDAVGRQLFCCFHVDHLMRLGGAYPCVLFCRRKPALALCEQPIEAARIGLMLGVAFGRRRKGC
jgi:hypothetical protein